MKFHIPPAKNFQSEADNFSSVFIPCSANDSEGSIVEADFGNGEVAKIVLLPVECSYFVGKTFAGIYGVGVCFDENALDSCVSRLFHRQSMI